jgi:hypothetical protein
LGDGRSRQTKQVIHIHAPHHCIMHHTTVSCPILLYRASCLITLSKGGRAIDFEGGISPWISTIGFSYAFPTASNDWHAKHPLQPVIESESSSMTGDRGVYSDDGANGHLNGYDRPSIKGYTRYSHGDNGTGSTDGSTRGATTSSSTTRGASQPPRTGLGNWGTSAELTWQEVWEMNTLIPCTLTTLHHTPTIHPPYTHTTHPLYTHYTPTTHSLYAHYTLTIHPRCTHYALTVHSPYRC